jgi:hypothetical protein
MSNMTVGVLEYGDRSQVVYPAHPYGVAMTARQHDESTRCDLQDDHGGFAVFIPFGLPVPVDVPCARCGSAAAILTTGTQHTYLSCNICVGGELGRFAWCSLECHLADSNHRLYCERFQAGAVPEPELVHD